MTEDLAPMTCRASWQGIPFTVECWPVYDGQLVRITITSRGRQPLPVTDTGLRICWLCPEDLALYPGPAAFVLEWIECAAAEKGWTGAQMSLF